MAEEKVVVTLDNFEQRLMVSVLADFRNDLIRDEKPTEDVDELILKVIDAPTEKARKKADRAARVVLPAEYPALLSRHDPGDLAGAADRAVHGGRSGRADPELWACNGEPVSCCTLRRQRQSGRRAAFVLCAGHRCLPLHPAQLPQAGGTRLCQVGLHGAGQQEIRRRPLHGEQNSDAECGHWSGRPQAPAQPEHAGLRWLRRRKNPLFCQAEPLPGKFQLCCT